MKRPGIIHAAAPAGLDKLAWLVGEFARLGGMATDKQWEGRGNP